MKKDEKNGKTRKNIKSCFSAYRIDNSKENSYTFIRIHI